MAWVLLCSFDSFLASLSIGLLGCPTSTRRKLILGFAAFDFSAIVAGASLHSGLAQIYHLLFDGLNTFLLTVALAFVAAAVLAYSRRGHAALLWVPVLLGLDNFIAGLHGGSNQLPQSALIAGLTSGLAAWAGFVTARHAAPLFSQRIAVVASVSVLILAFVLTN
jgi:putative Mn2+ efflux pump MntP